MVFERVASLKRRAAVSVHIFSSQQLMSGGGKIFPTPAVKTFPRGETFGSVTTYLCMRTRPLREPGRREKPGRKCDLADFFLPAQGLIDVSLTNLVSES
jgi:hypothetical protein